ncbi:HD domain-containing protein [Candidatus Poribacteria bacterium]|nr:HD domain-containing protein [Candidatus Poribacteria bacterium]MYA98531.1 HD domain-containing protein [Candidatus Poribacteria bacterium]
MTQNGTGKNQIEEAIEIAAEAHQGQYRKGTNTPYITHPYAVGLILMEAGCPEAVIIAGILHDTVEDTDLTLEFIRERFGDAIANIVDGCSEDKALRWRARKTERIEALRSASPEVCTVTCADKLHNLRTIISEYDLIGDAVWDRFHGGVEDQAWYYRSVLGAIADRDVALQKSGGRAKLTTFDDGARAIPDAKDTAPQHEPSDCNDAWKKPAAIDVVNAQLFQQFQQAVAYLFEGRMP